MKYFKRVWERYKARRDRPRVVEIEPGDPVILEVAKEIEKVMTGQMWVDWCGTCGKWGGMEVECNRTEECVRDGFKGWRPLGVILVWEDRDEGEGG